MKATYARGALMGAIALALAGTATATTNVQIVGSPQGDLFLTIDDYANSTSYMFDTGITQSAFNSGLTSAQLATINTELNSDTNLSTYVSNAGGLANLNYSLFTATYNSPGSAIVDFTSSVAPVSKTPSALANAIENGLGGYVSGANNAPAAPGMSVNLSGSLAFTNGDEINVANNLGINAGANGNPYSDSAAIGSSIGFYNDTFATGSHPAVTGTSLGTTWDLSDAGTWDLTYSGVASGTGPSPVPLPTPVVLLLSGLGLMGLLARRNGKSDFFASAA